VRVFSRGNEILIRFRRRLGAGNFQSPAPPTGTTCAWGSFPDRTSSVRSIAPSPTAEKEKVRSSSAILLSSPTACARSTPEPQTRPCTWSRSTKHELVFGVGPAGTGKTYLAVAQALKQSWARANGSSIHHEARGRGQVKSLGYLPGDLTQKIHPLPSPAVRCHESLVPMETFRRMEGKRGDRNRTRLHYMRGRTLTGAFIIWMRRRTPPASR